MKVDARKIEVMVCGKTGVERVKIVDILGGELPQVDKFKYLGATRKEGGG